MKRALGLQFLLVGVGAYHPIVAPVTRRHISRFGGLHLAASELSVSVGEEIRIEVDVADGDNAEELVWAAARVSEVDKESGEFYVHVHEWASLASDDPEREEVYREGPYVAAQEDEYSDEYDGRWRRAPTISESWSPWTSAVLPTAGGQSGAWWTQDAQTVCAVILLPPNCKFKHDVTCKLSSSHLKLRVTDHQRKGRVLVDVDAALTQPIDLTSSSYFVEDTTSPPGFQGFWPGACFLVFSLRKRNDGMRIKWPTVMCADDEQPTHTRS